MVHRRIRRLAAVALSAAMLSQTETELARHPGETKTLIFSGTTKTGVKQAQAIIAGWLRK